MKIHQLQKGVEVYEPGINVPIFAIQKIAMGCPECALEIVTAVQLAPSNAEGSFTLSRLCPNCGALCEAVVEVAAK